MSRPQRVGLPESLRMRHEPHFVDQLSRPSGVPVGRLIPLEDIDPNPNQPRRSMGDLTELIASVREKGVLEPILVRPFGKRFQIIAGERRYRAAGEAGLGEIPCIVRETGDAETMELALIENLQREDLSPFEEADGLNALVETHGYTHERMAERLGRSRSSITEALSLTNMPADVREQCRRADIRSKSLLLQVVRQSDPEKMIALLDRLREQGGATRQDARRIAKEVAGKTHGRSRNYVFRHQPSGKSFTLSLKFRKTQVAREEIVRALQAVIEDLMREDG